MAPKHRNKASPGATTALVDVDEEYKKALQTKSFTELWAKVHNELEPTISSAATSSTTDGDDGDGSDDHDEEATDEDNSRSSPLLLRYYARLPDFLLDPSQESLHAATARADDLRALLLEFIDTTSDACTACTTLLASIDRARSRHQSIRRLLLKVESHAHPDGGYGDCTAFAELASHVELGNPLSPQNLVQFHLVHARYAPLLRRLTKAHRRIVRRVRLIRMAKKAAAVALIGACGAATVAALVVAGHAVVGIGIAAAAGAAAAPAAMAAGSRAAMRWGRRRVGRLRRRASITSGEGYLSRMGAQVDAAAKGAYIVGRDLDTLSRMVRRAHDEVEHGRDVARMLLRNREQQLAREVVKEVEGGEGGFVEQLGELEEHVYLCLITINRSRRLVAQEIRGTDTTSAAREA